MWQDSVLAAGQGLLDAMAFVMFLSKEKPSRKVCLIIAVVLTSFALALGSLNMAFGYLANAVGALIYAGMFLQGREDVGLS